MGRGIAEEAAKRYPDLPINFGKIIVNGEDYHLVYTTSKNSECIFGALQTKRHFRYGTPIDLLKESINKLIFNAINLPSSTFYSVFPGIGYGGLTVKQVTPLIEKCPDNVRFYRK